MPVNIMSTQLCTYLYLQLVLFSYLLLIWVFEYVVYNLTCNREKRVVQLKVNF